MITTLALSTLMTTLALSTLMATTASSRLVLCCHISASQRGCLKMVADLKYYYKKLTLHIHIEEVAHYNNYVV